MNAAEKIEHTNVVAMPQASSPMAIIHRAIESGASVETLEKLMGLQERFEANEAKKEFALAMAAAKAEIRPVIKGKTVDFTSPKGRTNYQYEDLASIADAIDPILAKHGLSYRYRSSQDGGGVSVTCIVGHQRGHSEETTLTAFRDESGNKNPIQAIGSTVTYLQRYTLKLAFGLAATKDTDGALPDEPSKTIDDAQYRYLQDLMEKSGSNEGKLLTILGASDFESLTQAQYQKAEILIRKKMAETAAKAAAAAKAAV